MDGATHSFFLDRLLIKHGEKHFRWSSFSLFDLNKKLEFSHQDAQVLMDTEGYAVR